MNKRLLVALNGLAGFTGVLLIHFADISWVDLACVTALSTFMLGTGYIVGTVKAENTDEHQAK